MTPLHLAAVYGSLRLAKRLINNGAQLQALDLVSVCNYQLHWAWKILNLLYRPESLIRQQELYDTAAKVVCYSKWHTLNIHFEQHAKNGKFDVRELIKTNREHQTTCLENCTLKWRAFTPLYKPPVSHIHPNHIIPNNHDKSFPDD